MAASKSMTSGKAKKSGKPRMAPKVGIPKKDKPFSKMKSMDDKAISCLLYTSDAARRRG